MAETIYSNALTTIQRVKDRLTITVTGFDALFLRLINGITDYIEKECGRKFKEAAYSNEVYSVFGAKPDYLILKQAPVSTVSSLQYRAGTKTNPSWTDFVSDDWELLENGESGIIKVYGGVYKGINAVRVSYTAGYKFDFVNFGDITKHSLPADLTDLAERLVVKLFKKREAEGKSSEGAQGGNLNWKEFLDESDKETIARYRRNNLKFV